MQRRTITGISRESMTITERLEVSNRSILNTVNAQRAGYVPILGKREVFCTTRLDRTWASVCVNLYFLIS
eukprot:SAG22_NODE_1110_length_5538_cov_3.596433_2_plen_70_part_00